VPEDRERAGEVDTPPKAEDGGTGNGSNRSNTLLGWIIFLVLVGGLVWLVAELAPHHVKEPKAPGFIDNIFASPIVVAAARLVVLAGAGVLLFGGLYIVGSVVVRMSRQEWLRRAGWFESQVSEAVAAGLDQADDVFNWWMEALQENEQLGERLAEADQTIQHLLEEREVLIQRLGEQS
jgi:hypothetical protein